MRVQNEPTKAVVSVVEMSEMVGLSKSRFYTLMDEGVFPKPVQNTATKRPVFDFDTQKKVLSVRRTGIAADGRLVLFNRKLRKATQSRNTVPDSTEFAELTDALKSLGLTTTNDAVAQAVADLYSDGDWKEADQGEVIRQVFLHIQSTGATK